MAQVEDVKVNFTTTVSKGLLTYAGLSGALGQYAVAVALFLDDPDKALALGPLATATATLLGVIAARAKQAGDAIKATHANLVSPVGPQAAVALSRAVAGDLVLVSLDQAAVLAAQDRKEAA